MPAPRPGHSDWLDRLGSNVPRVELDVKRGFGRFALSAARPAFQQVSFVWLLQWDRRRRARQRAKRTRAAIR